MTPDPKAQLVERIQSIRWDYDFGNMDTRAAEAVASAWMEDVEKAQNMTLKKVKERLELYPPLPVCTQSLLNGSCKHTDCAHSRAINETVEDICKASFVVQLTNKPKEGL
jgi:hypothetical protein